jgi:S-adenosylmethionine-diacylglycerol 3-amino-3-carboxypropyl transferase
MMAVMDWVNGRVFNLIHGNNLVYNTCWEDPALDRVALDLGPDDRVMVITSAGCNALDYALTEPQVIHAVDMNPRQNALLELKVAGIRNLEFEDFFAMFGQGRLPGAAAIYEQKLRNALSDWSRRYWDRWVTLFDRPDCSFYFRGTSGVFARLVNFYIDHVAKVRSHVQAILEVQTLEEQKLIYEQHLRDRFWRRSLRFAMNRDATLAMVGVPKAQRRQVERQYEGGILKFIQDCLDAVFGSLPIVDNYFWRVYITGRYTHDCCPEYLRPEGFQRLQQGLVDRIRIHTNSVQGFLEKHDDTISRFVLLDHMDWLSDRFFAWLEAEWQAIIDRAARGARLIWRSGGLQTDFLDRVTVRVGDQVRCLPELLGHHTQQARELHARDRVHTYGSFCIADLTM